MKLNKFIARRSARRSTLTKQSLKLIKTKNPSPRAWGCARGNALGERGARGRAEATRAAPGRAQGPRRGSTLPKAEAAHWGRDGRARGGWGAAPRGGQGPRARV
jgi:hypothetical protein